MGKPNYYEMLQIKPDASSMDIINAYRQAKLTYRQDSLAVYSLYSDEELVDINAQIDQAYEVLSDREKRRAYDQGILPATAPANVASTPAPEPRRVQPLAPLNQRQQAELDPELERRIAMAQSFSGSFLREIREARQITLDDIAEETKINKQYLRAIEEEAQSDFPATVYLKSYLRQYAAQLGLDAQKVVQSYRPLIS